ncbi:FkbM family methyltransferase [Moraxella sp.]|uniref:FkbM family methyltransferase n=1 Tax=Moraxella sp. TaxID=479 RepID=UPI0026DDA01F|nr:FkbM family methyltransferase [Moraxella sp.]MDO4895675.1 FkbM family methyltransferase [Moraxella sp.]
MKSSDNVIEVGSNIGLHSVPIAQKINHGKLFCFEPQRLIFQTLVANIVANGLSNVFACHAGVGEVNELRQIDASDYDTPWNYGSFSLEAGFDGEGQFEGNKYKEWVQIVSLDTQPALAELDGLRLLKIDAEGFEINVLNGAKNLIKKHRPIIFVEALPHLKDDLIVYLNQIGYRCFWFISDRYQENNFFNRPRGSDGLDFNLVCYHQDDTPHFNDKWLAKPYINQNLESLQIHYVQD